VCCTLCLCGNPHLPTHVRVYVSLWIGRYSLVHAIRKLASSSERIRLFGALVGVIDSRRFSKRVCDMVLGLVRILFPKFTSTVMRTRPEHKFFVTSYDALRAVRKTFPEYHVPFADSQMPLTAGAKLLAACKWVDIHATHR